MLTADTLKGVWALVATPWDEKFQFDEAAFRHNVAYQSCSGVDGLYTTCSSGEFYALTFDEFRRLVDIAMEEAQKNKMPVQVGCGGADTRSAIRCAEYATQSGANAIQIILPYYIELTVDEALDFVAAIASACGPVPLVHYNTTHAKLTLGANDYLRLVERVPNLIGSKLPVPDPLWFTNVCEIVPTLSHFTGEYTFVAAFIGGAKGIYSWLAVTNPKLAIQWHRACVSQDWTRAIEIQRLVNLYKVHVKSKWHGASDAAVNKADAALNPNIKGGLQVRPPYGSCTPDDLQLARKWASKHFPELLAL